MIENAIQRLEKIIREVPRKLLQISKEDFEAKPNPLKWSKKEILGHLINSAANNHQRFIRARYEEIPSIKYNQDKWNALHGYQELDLTHLIQFWTIYNQHMLEVIKRIPKSDLQKLCNTGGEENHTLVFLIEDYVDHLEHHLDVVLKC